MSRSRERLHIPGYQVVDYLGSGARSTIWRVRDRDRNRFYALKRVYKNPEDDGRYLAQAINEFRIARRLDHPAIRKCIRMRRLWKWFHVQELHLFMELCEGATCQANRPTEVGTVIDVFGQVAQALTHMHARGYLHADTKPNNIVVANDGAVKLIDFGQSCTIGTIKERIQGTPDFISPEQVHRRPLDGRTDVFNFGAALYWTLTGTPIPTVLPKASDGLRLVGDLQVVPPDEGNPAVPTALSRLVLDCIEPRPARRPQTIREVAGRLDLIDHAIKRGNGAIHAHPIDDEERTPTGGAGEPTDETGEFDIEDIQFDDEE